MYVLQSILQIFKKIDSFFLEGREDPRIRHGTRAIVQFQLFGLAYLVVLLIFDRHFAFYRFILYSLAIFIKLLVLKLSKNHTIAGIVYSIDWIITPYIALQKVDIILRSAAFLLLVPYGVSLYYIPEKFSLIIAIMNFAVFMTFKNNLPEIFAANSKEFVVASVENFCSGIIVMMLLVWILGSLQRRKFDDIFKEHSKTSIELKLMNSKLIEANLKYQETVQLLEDKNRELKESKSNLEEAVKAKDQLLASVSHELRNPLNSLLGNIELISFEIKDKKLKEMLDVAKFCGEILLNLINNLLDAAKFTSDKLEINYANTDLFEIIEKVWRVNSIKIRQKNLTGELYISKNCPQFLILDSQRVIQIVLNLLGNSIKFTEQGCVKFFVHWDDSGRSQNDLVQPHSTFTNQVDNQIPSHQPQDFESIYTCNTQTDLYENFSHSLKHFRSAIYKCSTKSKGDILSENYHIFTHDSLDVFEKLCQSNRSPQASNKKEGCLKFEIIDTGCGIGQEAQTKLFQPFAQEDSSVTRKYGGTGLGLFIINKILSKMNGIIRCHSEKNVGSDFIAILTCKLAPKKTLSDSPTHSKVTKYGGVRALVVDDNPYNTKVVSSFLSKFGIESTICYDGKEGYSTFVKHGAGYFSFVTLDIQMPEMDGISCAKMIRRHEKVSKPTKSAPIPLVFVSGNSNEDEKAECLDCNGDIRAAFFFRKPLAFTDCQLFLQAILSKTNLPSSSAPLRALVVDDDRFNLHLMQQFLSRENFLCDMAKDGQEAVDRVMMGENYDAIVMDCEMPRLDGISATIVIKKHLQSLRRKDVLIVGLTGHSDSVKIRECIESGMREVFHKPVNYSDLIKFLQNNVKK